MNKANMNRAFTCVLISDVNLQNFAGLIANDPAFPELKPIKTPFGQVEQTLLNPDNPCWQGNPDAALVWTRPQAVISSFNELLRYQQVPLPEILQQVDAYASRLIKMSARVKYVFVPSWVLPPSRRIFGVLDMKTGVGITNALMRMNLRLIERLAQQSNIHVLDTQKWIAQTGPQGFSPKLWYLGKIEYSNALFKEAAADLKAAMSGALGYARKLIIVDLDDTLWGGIVGDLGWENLILGGHHHIGEAYVDFQHALKSLQNRGIVLGIVSKNEAHIAMEAIDRHPEMVLRKEDFAGWRINWQDKAQNILELLAELNLGPQSAVFIDDNPAERARVKESLPEVFVPDWPDNPLMYPSALLSLKCFDFPSLSQEDFDRTDMYLSETRRQDLKKSIGSLDEWLSQLSIKVQIDALGEENLQRAAQLLNKTNQMNLSTRRMSESELADWSSQENHRLWTLRVSDKFGDAGLTGIISIDIQKDSAQIVDFILSCRVMGRHIEDVMVALVVDCARVLDLEAVYARYVPTSKNRPCLDFFKGLAPPFTREGEIFRLDTNDGFAWPGHIEVAHTEEI
jgi:FkbH-like protein